MDMQRASRLWLRLNRLKQTVFVSLAQQQQQQQRQQQLEDDDDAATIPDLTALVHPILLAASLTIQQHNHLRLNEQLEA